MRTGCGWGTGVGELGLRYVDITPLRLDAGFNIRSQGTFVCELAVAECAIGRPFRSPMFYLPNSQERKAERSALRYRLRVMGPPRGENNMGENRWEDFGSAPLKLH